LIEVKRDDLFLLVLCIALMRLIVNIVADWVFWLMLLLSTRVLVLATCACGRSLRADSVHVVIAIPNAY